MEQGFRLHNPLPTYALPFRSSGAYDSLVGSIGAPDGPFWVPNGQVRAALGRALGDKSDLEGRLDRKSLVVQELLARIDRLEKKVQSQGGPGASGSVEEGELAMTTRLREAVETADGEALRAVALQAVSRLEGAERQLDGALQEKAKLLERLGGITLASEALEKAMKDDAKSAPDGNEGQMSMSSMASDHGRGGDHGASDDDASESAPNRIYKRDSKGSSSGGRSARTVTISAVQFRNLRKEIRELTAEKEQLEMQCKSNEGREAGFYAELQKLQEELAGALQHKASLVRQFREFGHVRERLLQEVESLKEALDEEHMKLNLVEDALAEFRSLHVDLLSIVDTAAEPVEEDEIPVDLSECIHFWAARVRADMLHLVTASTTHAALDGPNPPGHELPTLANVVVTAQAHAEVDEPQPSPSSSSQNPRSNVLTVLKNDVRDLRQQVHDPENENASGIALSEQLDTDRRETEHFQARCEELKGARKHLEDALAAKMTQQDPNLRISSEQWHADNKEGIYGGNGSGPGEGTPLAIHGQHDLHQSLQETEDVNPLSMLENHRGHYNLMTESGHPISKGRHLDIRDDSRPRHNPSHGLKSDLQADPNFKTSYQDVLLSLESEIELLRQKKLNLLLSSKDLEDDIPAELSWELSQKITDLQLWADEIELELTREAEDVDVDFGNYYSPEALVKS